MLPKKFRLTKSEFQAVRGHGRLLSARLLAILIHRLSSIVPASPAGRHRPSSKAGLIVSLRLSPKAVVRNRLKRRLRAALQRVLPEIPPNLHLVILPNHRALAASVEELTLEIKKLIGENFRNSRHSEEPQATKNPDEILRSAQDDIG